MNRYLIESPLESRDRAHILQQVRGDGLFPQLQLGLQSGRVYRLANHIR
jgi:hypothetical protein